MARNIKILVKRNIKPFIKYCLVGASGTLIDIGALYIFVEFFNFSVLLAATISFILAVTNNFVFNKIWTFRHPSKNYKKLYIKFFIVSVVGLGLTLFSMYLLVYVLAIWYVLAKIFTSGLVLTWNFLANKLWTFKTIVRDDATTHSYKYKLSITIPGYNEENRIGNTLEKIKSYIEEKNINAEIIVVDDGSQDSTKDIVKQFQKELSCLRLIVLKRNSGKGHAVRKGVEEALGEYILFTDADNSTPITELDKLLKVLLDTSSDIVIGSRYLRDDSIKIQQPLYRIVIGRIGNFLIRAFLIDGIKDTQCGFKLFRSEVAKDIFRFQKVKRFGFDMEMLVVAKNFGYKISETPVNWFNSPQSRLRPIKDSLITFKDLFYIKLNLWSGRYDRD